MSDRESSHPEKNEKRQGYFLDRPPMSQTQLHESLNGSSLEEQFKDSYGEHGVGWELIVEGPESEDNRLRNTMTEIESGLAVKALASATLGLNDEDSQLYYGSNPPRNRATHGDVGKILIYPAGDAFYYEKYGEEQ